jgi:DNA-binding transcriptional LysR family regulator
MNFIDINALDLNLLKVFEALYEEGGASRAAVRLGLTQSAVSAALGRLRSFYQDPLFLRRGRGLAPTPRADELKPILSEALDRCRQSLALAMDPGERVQRMVAVGLSDDFEMVIGRAVVRAVAQRNKAIRLIFRQLHSGIAAEALLSRTVDLAVASGGFAGRGLSRQVIGSGGYACLLDPGTAPGLRHLTLAEYLRRDHILISSGGVTGIVDEALAALGRTRRVAVSTTHFAALPYLLLGSRSVSTIPAHACQAIAGATALRVHPCPVPLPSYPVELGWRTSSQRDPAIMQVRDAIAACVGPFLS